MVTGQLPVEVAEDGSRVTCGAVVVEVRGEKNPTRSRGRKPGRGNWWARDLETAVAYARELAAPAAVDLSGASDAELLAELRRRGLVQP